MDFLKLAPYAAGSPPAVVLGFSLYKSVNDASGGSLPLLAASVAILGVGGMMTAEIFAYRKAFEALAMRSRGAFWLALIGALACSFLVAYAVYSGGNTRSLISSVIVAVIMYAMFGVDAYLKQSAIERDKKQLAEEKARNDRIRELNAETRHLKAQAGGASNGRPSVSTGQTGQKALNPEHLAVAVAYWERDKTASASSWVDDENCPIKSRETARHYKAAALEVIAKKEATK